MRSIAYRSDRNDVWSAQFVSYAGKILDHSGDTTMRSISIWQFNKLIMNHDVSRRQIALHRLPRMEPHATPDASNPIPHTRACPSRRARKNTLACSSQAPASKQPLDIDNDPSLARAASCTPVVPTPIPPPSIDISVPEPANTSTLAVPCNAMIPAPAPTIAASDFFHA